MEQWNSMVKQRNIVIEQWSSVLEQCGIVRWNSVEWYGGIVEV